MGYFVASYLDIEWPSMEEWRNLMNNWTDLHGIVGCIDGTSHAIYTCTCMPGDGTQRLYYSGHRKYHCIHSVVIIDNEKRIRYIHSGFRGHLNDDNIYRELPQISPNGQLQFPGECWLLADSIYPYQHPLITPFKQNQINAVPPEDTGSMVDFNEEHKIHRVYVEHVIGQLKSFRCISYIFCHRKIKLARLVDLCAALSQRRVALYDTL